MAKDSISFRTAGTKKHFGLTKFPYRKSYCLFEMMPGDGGVDTVYPLAWVRGEENAVKIVAWLDFLHRSKGLDETQGEKENKK